MEKRLAADPGIPQVLNAIINWHTRRGIRQGCLCNFCLEKHWGTRYIGYTPFPYGRYREMLTEWHPDEYSYGTGLPYHASHWTSAVDISDIARAAVNEERERKRNIVRERLRIAKEEI